MKWANIKNIARAQAVLDYGTAQAKVVIDVDKQVQVQLKKWGIQEHPYTEWRAILNEELAEMECSVVAGKYTGYGELVHVAAVALSWLTDLQMKAAERRK